METSLMSHGLISFVHYSDVYTFGDSMIQISRTPANDGVGFRFYFRNVISKRNFIRAPLLETSVAYEIRWERT